MVANIVLDLDAVLLKKMMQWNYLGCSQRKKTFLARYKWRIGLFFFWQIFFWVIFLNHDFSEKFFDCRDSLLDMTTCHLFKAYMKLWLWWMHNLILYCSTILGENTIEVERAMSCIRVELYSQRLYTVHKFQRGVCWVSTHWHSSK